MSTIYQELEIIKQQHNGILLPEHAVEWARENEDSELHKRLQWDDTVAGHQWRVQQVRQIISVHVRVIETGNETVPMRSFFSPVPESGKRAGGYVSTEEKLAHPDGRREIILQVLKRMVGIYESYPLDELKPIRRAISQCQKAVMVLPAPEKPKRLPKRAA